MGLPEYFAGGSLGLERQIGSFGAGEGRRNGLSRGLSGAYDDFSPLVMVVADYPFLAEGDRSFRPPSLGYQFLFGLFPISYLYLQHDRRSLMAELMADTLQESGFTPLLVESSSGLEAAFRPDLVLRPRFEALSVNAYDAFFFRIISIQGSVLVEGGGKTVQRELALREYRSHAHAPLLSSLLERAAREVLRSIVAELPRRHSPRAVDAHDLKTPLLLEEPTFVQPPSPAVGIELAGSYGFDFTPPFTFASVRRIIQRGVAEGGRVHGVPLASLRGEWFPSREGSWWRLQTEIVELDLNGAEPATGNDAVRLEVHFRLLSRTGPVLASARCSRSEPVARSVDGALVVTVERAAAALATAFLQGAEGEGKRLCVFGSEPLESDGVKAPASR